MQHDEALPSVLVCMLKFLLEVFASSLTWIAASKFLALSLTPGTTSQKRSVFAVHKTITFSTPLDERKSLMSSLILFNWRTG